MIEEIVKALKNLWLLLLALMGALITLYGLILIFLVGFHVITNPPEYIVPLFLGGLILFIICSILFGIRLLK